MTTTAQRSAIATFFASYVPLANMFWLYGIAAGFMAGIVVGGLGSVNRELQQIAAMLLLAYLLAWYIGLWRSAKRYPGPELWKWAARAVVAMPFVGIVLTLSLSAVTRQGPQVTSKATAAITRAVASSATDKEGKACTEITEFLGECKRQPAPTQPHSDRLGGSLVPFTGKLDAEVQAAPSIEAAARWTQESTGSAEKGPWLLQMPIGSRFCRLADGAIVVVFPPGVRPHSEQANPFCASVSVTSPDQL